MIVLHMTLMENNNHDHIYSFSTGGCFLLVTVTLYLRFLWPPSPLPSLSPTILLYTC